jgi:hypothetical protein
MCPPLPDARPVAPVAPDLEDCCRSGCTPCVFDLYEAALERYEEALARYEAALAKQAEIGFPPSRE